MGATQLVTRQFAIFVAGGTALFVAIVTVMVAFVIRYNRRRHPVATEVPGNVALEILWIVVPTILVIGMFLMGVRGYRLMREVPEGAMTVKVTAFSFGWQFEYENGKRTQELFVPAGRPVRLEITSRDVIHSFFAPDLRVKEDAVPGMKTYTWFAVDKPREITVLCAEYCGVGHSDMASRIVAVPPERFDAWLADKAAARP